MTSGECKMAMLWSFIKSEAGILERLLLGQDVDQFIDRTITEYMREFPSLYSWETEFPGIPIPYRDFCIKIVPGDDMAKLNRAQRNFKNQMDKAQKDIRVFLP